MSSFFRGIFPSRINAITGAAHTCLTPLSSSVFGILFLYGHCTDISIEGAAHTARWGSCPSYSAARNPPPLSSLRSETGAVPRLGGGCTQAACFFSISSAAGSTSTASCCFPLRVLVGFCKSSALTASRACVCGILQVRSTVNCSRHHHAR